MPLALTLTFEIFNSWSIDFKGPFPSSGGYNMYILVAISYVYKWIEAATCRNNDQ